MSRRGGCGSCGSPQVGRYCGRCGARSDATSVPGTVAVARPPRRWWPVGVLALALAGAVAWAGGSAASDGVVLERPAPAAPAPTAAPDRPAPTPPSSAADAPTTPPTRPADAPTTSAPSPGVETDGVRCLTPGCVAGRTPLPGPSTTVVGLDGAGPAVVDAGFLTALDADDGGERWRTPIDDLLDAALSPLDLDGRIAVTVRSDRDGVVVATERQAALIDAATGERRWTFTSPSWGVADVAVTPDLVLLTGSTAGGRTPFPRLTALDRRDGSVRWERLTTALVRAEADRVVVRTSGEVLQGLDPDDGTPRWERPAPTAAASTRVLGPWLAVTAPGAAGALELIDPRTGTTRAALELPGSALDGGPDVLVLADGATVLGLDDGDRLLLQAVGPDGSPRWSAAAPVGTTLLDAGTEVVGLGPDGELRRGTRDGRELPSTGAPRIAEVLTTAGPLALARTPGAAPEATGLVLVDVARSRSVALTVRGALGAELEPVPGQPRWLRLDDQLLRLELPAP